MSRAYFCVGGDLSRAEMENSLSRNDVRVISLGNGGTLPVSLVRAVVKDDLDGALEFARRFGGGVYGETNDSIKCLFQSADKYFEGHHLS